ncbi:hypothetical protein FC89_GL002076 [Liquorilactobacillus ghanensis DSM 18630]|uniref:Uncharacterized protein n=1 Tax=Liquorilactobacillus ghanensis DSM 18630 TaxID=1423750 RepID=A0A0R1VR79_9LACO|nr:hypothetical protein FC89_GL002076 [Liquorilactobacillus ghanensis DSM 18630]
MKRLRKNKKKLGIIAVIVVIFIGLIVAGVKLHHHPTTSAKKIYRTIKLQQQEPLTLMGKVAASKTQILQNPVGKVQQVEVQNGQTVTQGQELLTTYSDSAHQAVTSQQQEINKLQRNLNSANSQVKQLQQQLAATDTSDDGYNDLKQQLTQAQDTVSDTQAELTSSNQKLQQLNNKVNGTLKAPYNGVIDLSYTPTGTPQIKLQAADLQATSQVSEYNYAKLNPGTKIQITAVATKEKTTTEVAYLSKTAAADSTKNEAKYQFTAPVSGKYMDGQTIKIAVAQTGIRIPTSAIYHGKVFVTNQHKVSQVISVSGLRQDGYLTTDNNDLKGQTIITNPDAHLKQGSKVAADD